MELVDCWAGAQNQKTFHELEEAGIRKLSKSHCQRERYNEPSVRRKYGERVSGRCMGVHKKETQLQDTKRMRLVEPYLILLATMCCGSKISCKPKEPCSMGGACG